MEIYKWFMRLFWNSPPELPALEKLELQPMIVEPQKVSMFNLWINGKLNQTLIEMLLYAEVRGTLENHDDNAIGDKNLKHKAYGCMQIRQPYMTDACQYAKVPIKKAEECLGDHNLSVWAVEQYMKRYVTEKRLGYKPTLEDACRAHNSGGVAFIKYPHRTDAYWKDRKSTRLNSSHSQ